MIVWGFHGIRCWDIVHLTQSEDWVSLIIKVPLIIKMSRKYHSIFYVVLYVAWPVPIE